jgi:hypothetical protein
VEAAFRNAHRLKRKFNAEMHRLDRALWFRVERKLGLV